VSLRPCQKLAFVRALCRSYARYQKITAVQIPKMGDNTRRSFLAAHRLFDQVREQIRCQPYGLKTEKAYLYWVRFFIRWSAARPSGMRHPRGMGEADVEPFWSMLANDRKVSASTQNQALSAVLFSRSVTRANSRAFISQTD
jgi:Phage integrase, N-terminal SAM-like domain